MPHLQEVHISPQSLDHFGGIVSVERLARVQHVAADTARRMEGRVWWNVNSTAHGGGVAEMLQSLLGYALGAGITTRWLAIEGSPDFFRVTKRLHHALHGEPGDGEPLGDEERSIYEQCLEENASNLLKMIRPGDVVILHDPQTAGFSAALAQAGAVVIWQSHVGADVSNGETALAWSFLMPYLGLVQAAIFTRRAYIPPSINPEITAIIPPSIDPFSVKNQDLDEATVRAILVQSGLIDDTPGEGQPV
jgi:trehalose synthase